MNRTAACFTLHATWILHSDTWYLLLTLKHQLLKRTAEILTVKPSLTTGWSQIKHGEKSNAFRTNRTTEDAISTAYLTSSQAGRESLGWQSLLLYVGAESSSLFTHVGTLRPPDSSDVKYADDNSIIISNINNDESLYWEEISHRAEWCTENKPLLNVRKSKRLIVDLRKKRWISGDEVESTDSSSLLRTCRRHHTSPPWLKKTQERRKLIPEWDSGELGRASWLETSQAGVFHPAQDRTASLVPPTQHPAVVPADQQLLHPLDSNFTLIFKPLINKMTLNELSSAAQSSYCLGTFVTNTNNTSCS